MKMEKSQRGCIKTTSPRKGGSVIENRNIKYRKYINMKMEKSQLECIKTTSPRKRRKRD